VAVCGGAGVFLSELVDRAGFRQRRHDPGEQRAVYLSRLSEHEFDYIT
jgi:hypothetical protein